MLCWWLGVAGGATLMWLGAALFGGMTATAAAPTLSTTAAARHRTDPSTVSTGQPHDPAEPGDRTIPRVKPVSMSTPLTKPAGTATADMTHPSVAASVPSDVWDQVAQCESGGRWNISTDNGYHGGLQFTPSTWKAYGGGKYASTANKATKEQQIEIARKVLAGQGPGAWPNCGRKAGLTRAHAQAGAASETAKPAPQPAAKPGDEAAKVKHKVTDKTAKATDKARDTARDTKVSKYQSTVKSPRKHGKAGHGATAAQGKLVVHSGDTLSKLATSNHVKGGWRKLYEANRDRLSSPHLIRPGQELVLPLS
jgi:LysM repeat protein